MCRMTQGSPGSAPNTPQFGIWPSLQQHLSGVGAGRRRYKFETKLGTGRYGGDLHRARCEMGELWAIEVIKDEAYTHKQQGKRNNKHTIHQQAQQPEPWWQPVGEEEVLTDARTGYKCIVTKLPKESMRQRIMSDASYGLELVVKWGRQLASSIGGEESKQGEGGGGESVTLDNVWLDEADCVLVGDYYTEPAYYTPSTASEEEEGEEYFEEEEEEEEEGGEGEDEKERQQQQQIKGSLPLTTTAQPPSRGEERQGVTIKVEAYVDGDTTTASSTTISLPSTTDPPGGESAATTTTAATLDEKLKKKLKKLKKDKAALKDKSHKRTPFSWLRPSSMSFSSSKTSTHTQTTATAAAAVLSREEELKRYGVVMYQVAAKTILPGDVDTARQQILRKAEAASADGGKNIRQALLDLLYVELGVVSGGSVMNPALTLKALKHLANVITDALLGKLYQGVLEDDMVAQMIGSDIGSNAAAACAVLPPPPPSSPPALRKAKSEGDSSTTSTNSTSSNDTPEPTVPLSLRPSFSCPPTTHTHTHTHTNPLHPIIAALNQTHDLKMRQRAFVALGKLGAKAAEPPVIQALITILNTHTHTHTHTHTPSDRRLAAWTLGSMGACAPHKLIDAVTPLIRTLGDEDSSVRAASAWALGNLGRVCEERGAVATLLHRSIKDVDVHVREMAMKSLARVGKVTGKRRRGAVEEEEEEEDGQMMVEGNGSGGSGSNNGKCGRGTAAYAKRRPVCLDSATLSMEMSSISGPKFELRASPVSVPVFHHHQLHQLEQGHHSSNNILSGMVLVASGGGRGGGGGLSSLSLSSSSSSSSLSLGDTHQQQQQQVQHTHAHTHQHQQGAVKSMQIQQHHSHTGTTAVL